MKKPLFILIFFLSIFSVNAQEQTESTNEPTNQNFSEIKLNALFLILGGVDVTYEYILNKESGIGITGFLPISKDVSDDVKYYLSPYYRFYFGKKYAGGFFVEGFGMLNSTKRYLDEDDSDFTPEADFVNDFAVGFGFGGKWITSRNITFELSMGIGRNLFHSYRYDDEIIGKGGFIIGYRF